MRTELASDKEMFQALFMLAGITVTNMHELPNGYWPETYADLRAAHPWQLAITSIGPIKIGWRKRVISIDWQDADVRCEVTADDVTKGDAYVHAYSYPKALEYLNALRSEAEKQQAKSREAAG